jgi:hypothetical protein
VWTILCQRIISHWQNAQKVVLSDPKDFTLRPPFPSHLHKPTRQHNLQRLDRHFSGYILTMVDRYTMAVTLEKRSPLKAPQLLDFSARLSDGFE